MKRIKNSNSGFTLVELIIAMAVLAFLMTAVGSLMGSSVASHRKQKAEIRVHTSAQQTYNQITDSIMQAQEVVIIGYEATTDYNFDEPGKNVGATPELVYYVKDDTMAAFIKDNPKVFATTGADSGATIKYFSDVDPAQKIYVKSIAIKTAVPIELSNIPSGKAAPYGVNQYKITNTLAAGGAQDEVVDVLTTASGTDVFASNDTLINIYSFDANNMYYERQYGYMTLLNDVSDPADSGTTAVSKVNCIYNQGLSYVKTSDTTPVNISGCVVTVDAKAGAIGIDLMFNDKNMTYTTNGMINIRNSYVLKGKDK